MGSQRIDPVLMDTTLPWQQTAINQLMGTNIGPTNVQNQAYNQLGNYQNYYNDVVGGKYLTPNSNPYLKGMAEAATRPVWDQYDKNARQLTAQANAMGAGNSSSRFNLQGQLLDQAARQAADVTSNLYGNAYAQERGYQNNALSGLGQIMQLGGMPNDYALQRANMLMNLANMNKAQLTEPQYAPSGFGQLLSPLATLGGYFLGGPGGAVVANKLFGG